MLSVIERAKRFAKKEVRLFLSDERGDFSIKGLAITIGAIIVIGSIVLWLSGSSTPLTGWIEDVWENGIWPFIQTTFNM